MTILSNQHLSNFLWSHEKGMHKYIVLEILVFVETLLMVSTYNNYCVCVGIFVETADVPGGTADVG